MKYFLIVFLFFIFPGFSQNAEETIQKIPPGVKLFDQKLKVQYRGSFSKFGHITLTDSITGKITIFKNNGQLDTYTESFIPFDGHFYDYFSETTVPPLLDSLADGTYAMLYTSFPYGDGDTVKFKTDAVYALIPVKNFMVNGTVSWYYPNGKLAQKSEYLNGEKQGETLYIERGFENDQITLLEKKQYQSNIEDGTYYAEYNRNISKDLSRLNFKKFVCTANKKKGIYDGDFAIHTENEVFISGRFKEGQAVDHWVFKQWTLKGKKLVLLPNMEFEVNDDSVMVYSDHFIHRNLYSSELIRNNRYQPYPNHRILKKQYASYEWLQYMEIQTLVEEWNTDRDYTGKNNFSITSSIRSIQNCLGLLDKNNNNELWVPDRRSYAHVLVDSAGNLFKEEDLVPACGIYYDFKQFKCYHPNGKIQCSFDFLDTANIAQTPVFREDGGVLNEIVLDKKDGLYHLKEYTLKGKKLYESVYDKSGKLIAYLDPSETKIVDGDTLSSHEKSNWSFYGVIRDSSENRSICLRKIIDYKTNQLIESHYYNPVTKKGKVYKLELETGTSLRTDYEYDTLLQTGSYKQTYSFNNLSLNVTGKAKNWDNKQFSYYIANGFGFDHQFELGDLMQNGKPFSGNFSAILSDKKQPIKISFSKGNYSITLNRENNALFNSFLFDIHSESGIDRPLNQKDYYWLSDSVRREINLKTILFSIKNGKAADSIVKKAANGYYLSKYYIPNDSLVAYNRADEWLNRIGNVNEEEFRTNWLSGIRQHADSGKIYLGLDYNSMGDTAYYFYRNDLTGVTNHYQKEEFKITRWNSLRDTFLNYYSHNTYFGDYFQYDRVKQICREYWKRNAVLREFLLKDDQVYQINFYDTTGTLAHESFLKNGYLSLSKDYYNGQLAVHRSYFPEDSVIPNLQGLPEALDLQIIRYAPIPEGNYHGFGPRAVMKSNQREHFTRYQDEKVVEKGILVDHRKFGIWNYSYPILPEFQLDFHDTTYRYNARTDYQINSYTGTYREEKNGKPWKFGTFYEFDSEYNCGDNNYSEQYIIQYDLWNGESTKGKSIPVINYYPNGTKMNEGMIVNGKPEGLWLWYHNDGLLFQAGKYHNGLREGRWMKGDLSKVRFTGETCLDPTSKEYRNIIENIVVEIIYYEKSLVTKSESHELNIGK
jgi:antitoxin component YwqK of YwqJK toxin-antitoxin module